MNCGIGHRCDLDTAWLWLCLWHRLAVAGPIQPLAWELPYATGVAVKRQKKKKGGAVVGRGVADPARGPVGGGLGYFVLFFFFLLLLLLLLLFYHFLGRSRSIWRFQD